MKVATENMEANIFARPIEIVKPDFDSTLTDLIMDLEHLRRRKYGGSTPFEMFVEIKSIFHLLESLGSARLEGNRTAMAELIEENISPSRATTNEQHQEVRNIESALQFIDGYIQAGHPIDDAFIREVHKRIVAGLTPQSLSTPDGEGDPTPGEYRQRPITITGSKLEPPRSRALVTSHMASLVEFVQKQVAPKYDLVKIAIAHHRFAAIHPFNNGNGRTVRALTYAMLLQQEFSVADINRILNPTAIFCNDRPAYVRQLAVADKGGDADLQQWSEYVVKGLKEEIEKIDHLTDYSYVRDNILTPAIRDSLERKSISSEQALVLEIATNKRVPIMSKDIAPILPDYSSLKRSRLLAKMVELKLLRPVRRNSRQYVISFSNSYLLRGVIGQLSQLGFIPGSISQ